MEVILWFVVVFGSSLILQSLAFGKIFEKEVVKGHVRLFSRPNIEFYGLLQPFTMKPEDNMNDDLMRRQMSFRNNNLFFKCVKDDNKATVFVYAPEGYLIDRLKIESKDDCDKFKDRINIFGQLVRVREENGYEQLEYTIMYPLVGEEHRCLTRLYKLITFQYYTKLRRGDPQLMDCKEKTVIGTADIKYEKEDMLPWGEFEIMDLIKDADFVDKPSIITLNADSNIKLKCQQYTKKEKGRNASIQPTSIAIGYITYKNLILEKLILDSCLDKVEGVYINRLQETSDKMNEEEFELVFKTTKGSCFKISISYHFRRPRKDTVFIFRYNHQKVNCPDVWNSDAAFNVKPTWSITKWFHSLADSGWW